MAAEGRWPRAVYERIRVVHAHAQGRFQPSCLRESIINQIDVRCRSCTDGSCQCASECCYPE